MVDVCAIDGVHVYTLDVGLENLTLTRVSVSKNRKQKATKRASFTALSSQSAANGANSLTVSLSHSPTSDRVRANTVLAIPSTGLNHNTNSPPRSPRSLNKVNNKYDQFLSPKHALAGPSSSSAPTTPPSQIRDFVLHPDTDEEIVEFPTIMSIDTDIDVSINQSLHMSHTFCGLSWSSL